MAKVQLDTAVRVHFSMLTKERVGHLASRGAGVQLLRFQYGTNESHKEVTLTVDMELCNVFQQSSSRLNPSRGKSLSVPD